MSTIVRLSCIVVLAGSALGKEPPGGAAAHWRTIRSLMELDTPERNLELVDYLNSLSAEEMLGAARHSCRDAASQPGDISDGVRAGTAEIYVIVCLEYYFEKGDPDELGKKLLDIVRDTAEPAFFRRAIVARMWDKPKSRFQKMFQPYVKGHQREAVALLDTIMRDQREDALFREQAMESLAFRLRDKVQKITRSDPNVRAVWEKTHEVVRVGELVRSGELMLTEHTWNALKPIQKRILANATVLSVILANKEKEPETLRVRARLMLESYQRLPLTEAGHSAIDKAVADRRKERPRENKKEQEVDDDE